MVFTNRGQSCASHCPPAGGRLRSSLVSMGVVTSSVARKKRTFCPGRSPRRPIPSEGAPPITRISHNTAALYGMLVGYGAGSLRCAAWRVHPTGEGREPCTFGIGSQRPALEHVHWGVEWHRESKHRWPGRERAGDRRSRGRGVGLLGRRSARAALGVSRPLPRDDRTPCGAVGASPPFTRCTRSRGFQIST